jgi:hypothetical protein
VSNILLINILKPSDFLSHFVSMCRWNMTNTKIQKSDIVTHFWYIVKTLNPFYFALTICCLFHAIWMCDMSVVWKRRLVLQFVVQGSILPQVLLWVQFITSSMVPFTTISEFIRNPMKSVDVQGHFLLEWSQMTKTFTLMNLFMTNRVFKTIFKCLIFLGGPNKKTKFTPLHIMR